MKHNVLGHAVDVITVTKLDDDSVGLWERDAMRITISDAIPAAKQWQILWHETLHALLDSMGMERHSLNENLVIALATGITSVLANNPYMATPDATARVLRSSD